MIILLISVVAVIGFLSSSLIKEAKQNSEAKAVFYYCDKTYYIDSYVIKDDEVFAIDAQGKEIIFPRDRTVIKN